MRKLFGMLALVLSGIALAQSKPKELRLFNFEEYIAPQLILAFEKKFSARVKVDTYSNNEQLLAHLRKGNKGQYDVIVPSLGYVTPLTRTKLIQQLDLKQLPNLKNMGLVDLTSPRSAIPYFFGTTGILYRKDKINNIDKTWGILFDQKQEVGTFSLLLDQRPMIGAALKYLGKDWNSQKPEDLKLAQNLLLDSKKRSVGILDSIKATNLLRQGKILVTFAYNTNLTLLDPPDPKLDYFVPLEGSEIYYDMMAITSTSKQTQLAHQFINFFMDAKIAAENAEYAGSATPNEAAQALVKPKLRKNPMIYPGFSTLERLFISQSFSEETQKRYDAVWASLVK